MHQKIKDKFLEIYINLTKNLNVLQQMEISK